MHAFLITLHSVVLAADPTPADKEVKAGWGAFWIFIGLAVAVALLGWGLVTQLKRTQANADAGAFGDDPGDDPTKDS